MKITQKLIFGFLVIALLPLVIISIVGINQQNKIVTKLSIVDAQDVAKAIEESLSLEPQTLPMYLVPQDLQEILNEIVEKGKDFVVVDAEKKILADAITENIGTKFTHDQNNEVGLAIQTGSVQTFIEKSQDYPEGIYVAAVPFKTEKGQAAGAVLMEYKEGTLDAAQIAAKVFACAITHKPTPVSIYSEKATLQKHVEQLSEVMSRDVAVVDLNKIIVADIVSEAANIGTKFTHDASDEVTQTMRDGKPRIFKEISKDIPKDIAFVVVPLKMNHKGVAEGHEKIIGAVITSYKEVLLTGFKFTLLYTAVFAVLIVIISGLLLSRSILVPIIKLKNALVETGKGRLNTRIEIKSKDEIGELAASFNKMAQSLEQTVAAHDKGIMARKRTEGHIEKLNHLQADLFNPASLDEKLKRITDGVVEIFDADFCRIWLIYPGDLCQSGCVHAAVTDGPHVCRYRDRCLHLMSSSGRYTHIDGQTHRRVPFGAYKIGLIASRQKRKLLTNDVISDPEVHNHQWAKELGLVSFAGYPLHSPASETIGVLALFSTHPLSTDDDVILESLSNITAQVVQITRTQDSLKENESRYRTLFEGANDAIMVIKENYFIECNAKTLEIFGGTKEQFLKQTPYYLSPPLQPDGQDSKEKTLQKMSLTMEGKPQCFEWRYVRCDGTPFDAEVSFNRIELHNEVLVQAIVHDITKRKQTEDTLKILNEELEKTIEKVTSANRELQGFAHIIAHDLKSPVRAIGTLAHWIATDYEQKLDQSGKENLAILINRVNRMYDFLDGILDYSKLMFTEEGREKIDLNKLVHETIQTLQPPENIEINIENRLPTIIAGKNNMMQVFQNLLGNAIRYMDKPKGKIRIGCVEEDGFWKFSVADNGSGIDEKYFKKIFKIFQTLSPRDKFESTGVGLSIVKKTIEMHGGRIWVESEVGKGSTFFFTLPRLLNLVANETQYMTLPSSRG